MSPGKQSREARRHPDDGAPRDVWSGLLRTQSTRQNGLGLYRISQDCFDDQRLRRCWTDRKQPVRIASGSQTVRSALGYVLVLDKAYTFACVCSRARTCGCASACPRGWCVRVKRIVVREGGCRACRCLTRRRGIAGFHRILGMQQANNPEWRPKEAQSNAPSSRSAIVRSSLRCPQRHALDEHSNPLRGALPIQIRSACIWVS